jgi:hypothetical protein
MSEDSRIVPGQHGGFRPGAGRKPGPQTRSPKNDDGKDPYRTLAIAKAKREFFKAQMAEVDYGIKAGELYERGEVLRVIRTAIAVFAEQMRSLPDKLERSVGLTPSQAELAEDEVNNQLAELQNRLAEVLRDE